MQASLALAAVLLVVGAVVYFVDVRVQEQQIRSQLSSVALTADDATDPPPGMILVLRDSAGKVAASADGVPTAELLARPAGFSDSADRRRPITARWSSTSPRAEWWRLLDLGPYEAGRSRCCCRWASPNWPGIVASVAVVVLLTRRSIRPLADALALQRRFVADASHELRAPLTVLHTRIQLLGRRFDDGDAEQTKEQIDALASDTRVLGEVIEDLLASASMTSDSAPQDRVDLVGRRARRLARAWPSTPNRPAWTLVVEPHGVRPKVISWYSGRVPRFAGRLPPSIDNALAHEHRGGTIAVALRRHHDDVVDRCA